jgi:poly(A) polymerase
MTATLPDAPWRHRPGLDGLLRALGSTKGEARFVGGAVRDTLLGQPVSDIDIATIHEPHHVLERLQAAGIKAIPTGMAHGTITAVLEQGPVEITTLRRDVSTDGRRATIAFTTDWREDAARRDFTMNALYADPINGRICDYHGGVADLRAAHVRFIGRAADRIAEDHLRILRYFRFLARFGNARPDPEAYAACMAHANSLMALSRERVADEMVKLLAARDPVSAAQLMVNGGILMPVLPEIGAEGVARLRRLIACETSAGIDPSPIRRLCALLPADPVMADAVAKRLKLSGKARKRMILALTVYPAQAPEALAYRIGTEGAIDQLLLSNGKPEKIRPLLNFQRPTMPVNGTTLIARGMTAGPAIAKALREIEDEWVEESFPDANRVARIVDQIVSKFQRARQ